MRIDFIYRSMSTQEKGVVVEGSEKKDDGLAHVGHANPSVQVIRPGIVSGSDWVTTCRTRKRPIMSFTEFVKRPRYTRNVCQWEPLDTPYTPVLNGSHGEWTEGDDMSTSAKESNDARSRRHREAKTNRFSAGGSSRKGMGKEDVSNSETLALARESSDRFDHDDGDSIIESASAVSEGGPLSSHEIVVVKWGVYSENDSFLVRMRAAVRAYANDILDSVSDTAAASAAPYYYFGAALVGGSAAATITKETQPYLGKWGSRLLGVGVTSAVVAYNWFVERDTAPFLDGAGTEVSIRASNPTHVAHYDRMQYTSSQEGEVYKFISSSLISEFTGCRVDEHLARRAMKRANEICIEQKLRANRGILANTVSYALCVLNVEMARVGVSLRSYSGLPSSSGWS